jgi:hypothetical protein
MKALGGWWKLLAWQGHPDRLLLAGALCTFKRGTG